MVNIHYLLALLLGATLSHQSTAAAEANERSYVKTLVDESGTPFLRLTVEYLGKEPRGAFRSPHECIKKQRNTDFYNVLWENLTEQRIEFVSGERRRDIEDTYTTVARDDKGEERVVPSRREINMKAEFPGDRILNGKEKRTWNNIFLCYTNVSHNVLHAIYTVRRQDTDYKIDLYTVFEK